MRTLARIGLALLPLLGVATAAAPARAAEPAFVRSDYNHPEVTQDGAATVLRASQPPAGLAYTARLDPDQTYRVRLRGRVRQSGMVLRIARDDELEYTRTPPALTAFRVSGVSRLELLVFRGYQTDDEEYVIDEVSVAPCRADCPDDDDLRAQVLREADGLDGALERGDRLAAVTAINAWVAGHVAVPGGVPPLKVVGRDRTAAELYYDHFATAEAGVDCAGVADFMRKVLRLFDLPSFELDYGRPDLYTHAVVIVPDHGDWHLFDPTFGLAPSRVGGAPLGLFEALELWRAGQTTQIDLHEQPLADRLIVYDPDGDGRIDPIECGSDPASGWSGCSLANLAHDWDATFEANGLGTGYDALMALLAKGQVFSPDELDVPPGFVDTLARFQEAVASGGSFTSGASAPPAPEARRAPAITGVPVVGQTVTVDAGDWDLTPGRTPAGTGTVTVRWEACPASCASIPGATAAEYQPTADLVGARLRAVVIARNADDTTRVAVDAGAVTSPATPGSATDAAVAPSPASGSGVGDDAATAAPAPAASPEARPCRAGARIVSRGPRARRRVHIRICTGVAQPGTARIVIARHGRRPSVRRLRIRVAGPVERRYALGRRAARVTVQLAAPCRRGRCWRTLASRRV